MEEIQQLDAKAAPRVSLAAQPISLKKDVQTTA
jgi:hypothetical protein